MGVPYVVHKKRKGSLIYMLKKIRMKNKNRMKGYVQFISESLEADKEDEMKMFAELKEMLTGLNLQLQHELDELRTIGVVSHNELGMRYGRFLMSSEISEIIYDSSKLINLIEFLKPNDNEN